MTPKLQQAGALLITLAALAAILPSRAEAARPRLVDSFGVRSGLVRVSVMQGDEFNTAGVGIVNADGDQSSLVVFTKPQWASFIHYYNRAVANWSSGFRGTFHLGGVMEHPNSRRTSLDVYLSSYSDTICMGFAMADPKYDNSTIVLLDSEDCARFSYAVGRVNRLNGW